MHCNLRPSEPRQLFAALITTPCQVWRRRTYPLPYYSVFAADTLLYAVTLTFDLWTWTFATCFPWSERDESLYQIWTQSNNPRRSYCDFSVWPYDLEHCVSCCARIWDNFHQVWHSPTYTWMNDSVFYADTLCHAVTLTLTSWPWTFTALRVSCVKTLYKFERNRIINGWVIDDLARFRVQF